ncbi:DNA-binding domain-containing protein [Profundibacter sp.]|uniref:HvfC/BufC N-terminal domain-containing protein n=1 Tax=Profundibacter sp. TaxID=3101071 RepID=UPI003D0D4A9A
MSRQSEFAQAILNPDLPVPEGLRNPEGAPAGKRFSVYRNNVAVSLSEALEVTFPVIRKLVGDEFFKAMAGVFLRQHQPDSPVLMFYGAEMPAFLEGFKPVAHLGYLPDIARIELALCRSYHAADTPPLDPAELQAIAPVDLLKIHLHLVPSVHLVRSEWPAGSIFHANSSDDAPQPEMHAEDVLVTRPEFDPQVTTLPPGAGAFIAALLDNAPLGSALKQATINSGNFDLTETLGLLLTTGAIEKISEGT